MNIQPRFSGVYLEPASPVNRKPSSTGYEQYFFKGNTYYTTNEDTVYLQKKTKEALKASEEVIDNSLERSRQHKEASPNTFAEKMKEAHLYLTARALTVFNKD